MKNKQEQAQVLSESMEQVEDGVLQQAFDTDTAEKFRALSRVKTFLNEKDRQVSHFRRYATAAACLAFAIGLALIVGTFAENFHTFFPGPTYPTNPPLTQPPGTTQSSPTVPITTQPKPTETTPTEPLPTEPIETARKEFIITSGENSVSGGTECLNWYSLYDTEKNLWVDNTGNGAYGYLENLSTSDLLTLWYDGDIQLQLSQDGTLNKVDVYYMDENRKPALLEDFPGTVEALSDLPTGTWYVAFTITWQGDYVESDRKYESECYDHLIILEVWHDDLVSGTIGTDLQWQLHIGTGVMTISGQGSMTIPETSSYPWDSFRHLIQHVVIEEGPIDVAMHAFRSCENLLTVTLPDTLTRIESYAFSNCVQLSQISLPKDLYEIGIASFNGCTGLKQIVLPAKLQILDIAAFENCTNLTDISFLGSPSDIASTAFFGVTATVRYPGKDLSWNGKTLDYGGILTWEPVYCEDQHTINYWPAVEATCYSDGVTEGSYCSVCGEVLAYPETIPMREHTWGKWVVVIPPTAEQEGLMEASCSICGEKTNQLFGKLPSPDPESTASGYCGESLVWEYHASSGTLNIYGIGAMEEYSNRNLPPWREFAGSIHKVILPNGLTSISSSAFVGFVNLTEIQIPETVVSIGMQAFSECSALSSIVIPDNVQTIASMAFYKCTGLKTVTIGTGITKIQMYAFQQCSALEEIHFLGNMPSMSEAFYGLTTTIYYPAGNDTWDTSKVYTYETYITWVAVENP